MFVDSDARLIASDACGPRPADAAVFKEAPSMPSRMRWCRESPRYSHHTHTRSHTHAHTNSHRCACEAKHCDARL